MINKTKPLKNKKAVFFSTDALIALVIVTLTILVVFPLIQYSQKENLIQADILEALSSLKIGELANTNSYVQELIDDGNITDLNNSVLKQIGEFYITNEEVARQIANLVFSTIDSSENIGLWYGNDLLASKNLTSFESATEVDVKRQFISGLRDASEEGEAATAFSAKSFLRSNFTTKYFYFGGYIGDGNISVNIEYEGSLNNMTFEIAVNDEFDLYINDQSSGHYDASDSDTTPAVYDPAYEEYFSEGINTIKFVGDELYITGGYIKLIYENSVQYEQPLKYSFPGIEGLINIYDGFYIPGSLNTLDIFLHLNTSYKAFLTIGNITIFNDVSDGTPITIDDSVLSSLLDYSSLSNKTIPLRLGLSNVSYVISETIDAEVFSVTDLSGSMCECTDSSWSGWSGYCRYNQLNCETSPSCDAGSTCTAGIYEAKDANKLFINVVLNNSNNRVGLVGYNTEAYASLTTGLSEDNDSLIGFVEDNWFAGEPEIYTCICCGINEAVDELITDPEWDQDNNYNSIVVMSDGEANEECPSRWGSYAKQDAIQAACDAYDDYGIIVHSIGFGPNVDEPTLQAMAAEDCGNGIYNYGTVENIGEIYQQIAQEILDASYSEQTIEASGDYKDTILYPDSYISFNYTSRQIPFGLITTIQTEDLGNTETTGSFFVPNDAEIIEANVISYSGSKWTDNVSVYSDVLGGWESIFSLANYGGSYIGLGDPYVINLPLEYLKLGDNQVKITSGISPSNSTGSSASDKIIYTIRQSASGYSEVSNFAEGCIWDLQFEDDTIIYGVRIPYDYSGSDTCSYTVDDHQIPTFGKDAIQSAVWNLLELLDLDGDWKLDVIFTEQDLQISSSAITGIPYDYSIDVQVRKWS